MSEIKLNVAHRAEDNSSSIVRLRRKISDEIKRLIHARAIVCELWHVAGAQGMTTLDQDGVQKVLCGWTDRLWSVKAAATALNIYPGSYIERSTRPIISGQVLEL